MADFIAVDWGTTNLRANLGGQDSEATIDLPGSGISALSREDYPIELQKIRNEFGDPDGALPVLIAGMAGSNKGWAEAPYAVCPASVDEISAAVVLVPGQRNVFLIPGVRTGVGNRNDVMRGEETQILGADVVDGVVCLPGTHTKWVSVQGGILMNFATCMTGEIFQLLRTQSILRGSVTLDDTFDLEAFRQGVGEAKGGRFLMSAFGVRPLSLLGGKSPSWCNGYLSGLIIGEDVREGLSLFASGKVHIVGAKALGSLYANAMSMFERDCDVEDGGRAFFRGASRIFNVLKTHGRVT